MVRQPLHPPFAVRGTAYDAGGEKIGEIVNQRIYDRAGRRRGEVVNERIYNMHGQRAGAVVAGHLFDASGIHVGRIASNGRTFNRAGESVGYVHSPYHDTILTGATALLLLLDHAA